MPSFPVENHQGLLLGLGGSASSPSLLSPKISPKRRAKGHGDGRVPAVGWGSPSKASRRPRPGALQMSGVDAGDDFAVHSSNSPISMRCSWAKLNCTVKAGALTLNDRLVDRERNMDRDSPNFTIGRSSSASAIPELRRPWSTPAAGGIPPRAAKLIEKTIETRHRFTPAPLPDDGTYGTLSGRTKKKADPLSLMPTARSSFTVTKGCRLARLIESGCIALVRSSYFEDCVLHNRPFAMRQLIPNSFIWRGDEATNLWWKHGKCFLIIVSYPWLSKDHPDPDQFHLKKFVRILEEYKRIWNMHEVAVIMDYCSLWQKSARGDTRTAEQKDQYNFGMLELNVAYVHKSVTSIKLTEVPKGELRKYDDRGWTLLESIMIDSKGGDWNRWTFNQLDPDSTQWSDPVVFFMQARSSRLVPPLTAEGFRRELEQRRARLRELDLPLFSNERDNEEVPKRYDEFLLQLVQATTLSYDAGDWSDDDVSLFTEVALKCNHLEKLDLNHNRITLKGASELAKLFPQLPNLQFLSLKGNPLCQENQATDLLRLVWSKEKKPARNLVL